MENFYMNCSLDGIISNSYCAFVVIKEKENLNDSNNLDKGLDLMEALNENLDWLRSNGSY